MRKFSDIASQFNARYLITISFPRSGFACSWSQHQRKASGTWYKCEKLQWGFVVWTMEYIRWDRTCFYNLWSLLEQMLAYANQSFFTYSSSINSSGRYDYIHATMVWLFLDNMIIDIGYLLELFCYYTILSTIWHTCKHETSSIEKKRYI